MKRTIFSALLAVIAIQMTAQTFSISGTVLDKVTGKPIEFATIALTKTEQWAVADADGKFTIQNVQKGTNEISVSCLGYVPDTKEINISKDILSYKIFLKEDNLALESVVITAQADDDNATTKHTIDKAALNHIQMMNVADVSSLLPGGATVNPSLITEQRFNIRAGGTTEHGNPFLGTAVEVDGVRISNSASFDAASSSGIKGATTNNISSTNVESIEIITGVPSVEYGDMTSGVVKINTQKGVTPYTLTFSTNPNTKQASASKGFSLGRSKSGRSHGFLNAGLEYAKSIKDPRSPYLSYDRKQISLTYSNLFSHGVLAELPLRFNIGLTGNIGGMNTSSDPDQYLDSYEKNRDNVLRGNFSLNWLLSKKWITNAELSGSFSYGDRRAEVKKYNSKSAWTPVIHGREEGYFVGNLYEDNPDAPVLILPSGHYNYVMVTDDKPFNGSLKFKANCARQFGKINNRVKIGADWNSSKNFGAGQYSCDLASTTESYREYRYRDVPCMHNVSVYLEENITIPIGKTRLNLIAGLRNDNTLINGSEYGTVSGLSPRFNILYTVFSPKDRYRNTVKALSFRASWGEASKLPSNSILYPVPTYYDRSVFTSTSAIEDGRAFYAYHIRPHTIEYNSNLRWQKNRTAEIGMDINIDGYRISLSGYYTQTLNSYIMDTTYEEFSYNYTSTSAVEGLEIPASDRNFSVDRNTGIVTVSDRTGAHQPVTLPYTTRDSFISKTVADNSISPITRYGIEWTVDFKRIQPINTTIRWDGSFYGYRYVSSNVEEKYTSNYLMSDGSPYRYVGFFFGDNEVSNGSERRRLNTNITITTHIPKVRLILSMRLEACLLSYSRYLSERTDGTPRNFVISDKDNILSFTDASIYDGDAYSVLFPDTYIEFGDPTPRNYLADLLEAKNSDPNRYNDLSKLVQQTNLIYYYGKDYISPYFSANFSVTKEIGNIASISFFANNFFNNSGKVYSSKTKTYSSVSAYIPLFYYGLSLRLKF